MSKDNEEKKDGLSQEDIDRLLNSVGGFDDSQEELLQQEKDKIDPQPNQSLSQEDINKLISQAGEQTIDSSQEKQLEDGILALNSEIEDLTQEEKDTLGEISNISLGVASTSLSTLLNKTVNITTPKIKVVSQDNFDPEIPFVVVTVDYIKGLNLKNLLVIEEKAALTIANLMMGEEGDIEGKTLGELELSAVQEAMNQMMGTSATAMSDMFNRVVDISPPQIKYIDGDSEKKEVNDKLQEIFVEVSFNLEVEDILKSEMKQVISINNAKEMVKELLYPTEIIKETKETKIENDITLKGNEDLTSISKVNKKYDKETLKDVVLNVDVVYGQTTRRFKEILSWNKGEVVPLENNIEDYVDIYVNGVVVAKGEIIDIDGMFGVKIKKLL